MTAQLDSEHLDFEAMCRAFTDKQVRPLVAEAEAKGFASPDLWREMGAAGLLGLMTPEEHGGSGQDPLAVAIVSAELSRAAGGMAIGPMVSAYMAGTHIVEHGTAEQRERWSAPLAAGEAIASIAVTEPGAGSDVAGITTRAVETDEGYRISGQKMYITNAGYADVVIVGAKTEPDLGHRGITTFLVAAGTPGLSVGSPLAKMGWHSSDTREVVLEDVLVPHSAVLGDLNRGFYQIMTAFQLERIVLAAMAVGHAAEALELATRYVRDRVAFGAPLIEKQAIRHKLALMEIDLDTARLITHLAASQLSSGHPDAARTVAKAKYHAAVAAARVVDDAVQLHGGSGYVEESDIARHHRDVRILRIGGGADEVQLDILGKAFVSS
ncbi:acyl-CoA dehydrogenase family protein [Nocardioides sp. AX2bis]|uniref:acyl-CoA dehydrogenase family protein n=1 Tax=Nocardioides sp. AX2bis TaxID=2653157 RepID=UPI0012F11ABE|nr:acyl-CoA dehydrogenase family protein [Nocardioides sp. AX2bis]VXB88033.1 Acyl-CoA dehydrogenase [Nocardioides sp. AX2bis]